MTVPVQTPYNSYNANGVTTQFRYEFIIKAATDLAVTLDGVPVSPSAYTLTNIGQSNGGDVIFTTAPAAGLLIIRRQVIAQRLTDFQDNGPLRAADVNADLDRLTMMIQDKQADQDSSLKHPLGQNGTSVPFTYDAKQGRIVNLSNPISPGDAASKDYVDTQFGDVGQAIVQQAEDARDAAITAKNTAVAAKDTAVSAAGTATAAAGTATSKASDAAASASQAATSATNAANSASTASTKASDAAGSASTAQSSANGATTQATAASTSATNAANSATTATQKATAASGSATSAATAMAAAQAAQAAAELARDQAINVAPGNYMLKTLNLSDLSNKAQALINLQDNKPLTLTKAAVGVNDAIRKGEFDAALEQAGGGYVGQTIWHDNRAFPPDGYVAKDGQEIDQSAAPSLYQMVVDGKVPVTTEALWWSDVSKRGCYTLGATTGKFRLPDMNGVQTGSIAAPYMHGSPSGAVQGVIAANAAPNFEGEFQTAIPAGAKGSFKQGLLNVTKLSSTSGTVETGIVLFSPSSINPAYGRDGSTSVQPDRITGCVMVRFAGRALNAGSVDALTQATQIAALQTDVGALKNEPLIMTWAEAVTAGWLVFKSDVLTTPGSTGTAVYAGGVCTVYHNRLEVQGRVMSSTTNGTLSSTVPLYGCAKVPAGKTGVRKASASASGAYQGSSIGATGAMSNATEKLGLDATAGVAAAGAVINGSLNNAPWVWVAINDVWYFN